MLYVECGMLVGILAVAQRLRALERQDEMLGEAFACLTCEPARDRGIVGRGVRERLAGELAPELDIVRAVADRRENALVVRRVDDDGDRREVLGRGAHHRRT